MQLSVVMASMNEAQSIKAMIDEIKKVAPSDTEILLIDSSSDQTAEIAAAHGACVIKQPPKGHGAALKYGLNRAQGDLVLTMDCDLTYPIKKIPELITLMQTEHYDLISACRLNAHLQKQMPFWNKMANYTFAWIVRLLYRIKTHDVTTGMFLMRKELAHLEWVGNFSLPAEIIIRTNLLGKKYLEVPIDYHDRLGESTLSKWRSGKAYLRCFLRWKWGLFNHAEL